MKNILTINEYNIYEMVNCCCGHYRYLIPMITMSKTPKNTKCIFKCNHCRQEIFIKHNDKMEILLNDYKIIPSDEVQLYRKMINRHFSEDCTFIPFNKDKFVWNPMEK